jgi:hypothetical protein
MLTMVGDFRRSSVGVVVMRFASAAIRVWAAASLVSYRFGLWVIFFVGADAECGG